MMCAGLTMSEQQGIKEMARKTVPQLIASAGYPVEKHRVTTEDGYILQLHRIPAGRRIARRIGPSSKKKKAVLVVSGLLGSSGDFVIMGPERSLAYLLADEGYDVWLGNLRGDIYTSHTNYTRNNPKFWEYSFHEHGIYDLPASIDKVLEVTGLPKIMYIGFSMGTTSFFITLSEKPEYNDKVLAYMALAPAVYMRNVKNTAETLLLNWKLPDRMRERGLLSATIPRDLLEMFVTNMCYVKKPQMDVCTSFIYSVIGEDQEQYDWDMMAIIIMRLQPASWRQLEHFGKIALTDTFTSWEGGLKGAVKPYKLSNVKIPVSLFYGHNDRLTQKSQIMRLADELNATGVLEDFLPACDWPKFNHLDFVFAKDVGTLLNEKLVDYIGKMFSKYG
ncbi:lysosomal acid lipase [Danaus plexippus plexippus]|uniref:Lipase n=1 Tax=Danaus plexippus plexippus TaxID=278856 RepID=A0A212F6V0_DANPL|nr:lysosomal acid lipase [Danaus plexippus plexippus]